EQLTEIPNETQFWKFIKLAFLQPRRTLKNNLAQAHFDLSDIEHAILGLRAQEMSMSQLLNLWDKINKQNK
ncbi:MAG TPA: hypothetical protein VHA52_00645, partial [Candidatus Babeliaceae bacterium]|nr:hypothetical protein [Candidatus Babeliaceae bacterium]